MSSYLYSDWAHVGHHAVSLGFRITLNIYFCFRSLIDLGHHFRFYSNVEVKTAKLILCASQPVASKQTNKQIILWKYHTILF